MKPPRDIFSHHIDLHLWFSFLESYMLVSNFVHSDHVTWKRLFTIDIEFNFLLEARSFKVDALIEMDELPILTVILYKQSFWDVFSLK